MYINEQKADNEDNCFYKQTVIPGSGLTYFFKILTDSAFKFSVKGMGYIREFRDVHFQDIDGLVFRRKGNP